MFLIREYGPAGASVLGCVNSLASPLAERLRGAPRDGIVVAENTDDGGFHRLVRGAWLADPAWPALAPHAA